MYSDQSKYDAALAQLQPVFETRNTILGPDHRKTLSSENLLANCFYSLYKYDDAEPHYKHVLEGRTKLLGAEHSETGNAQNNLARNFYGQHRYEDAITSHRRAALAIREKILGEQHSDTRVTLVDLGDALSALATEQEKAGSWDPARAARQEVVVLRTRRYGEHDYHVTVTPNCRWTTSKCFRNFPTISRVLLTKADETHQSTANSYVEESTFIASTAESRQVWQTRKSILGADHRKTLTSENLLANCLYSSDKYTDAEPLYQHIAGTRLTLLGPDHPDTASSFNNLAKNFFWQRKYADAVTNHRIALATRRKVLGDQSSDTRQTMIDLADSLAGLATEQEQAAHWDEARKTREEVVSLRSERYGADDGRVADARQAVEDIERLKKLSDSDRGKLSQADQSYQTAVKLYTEESKYEAAETAIRAALEARKAILGPEHRKTLQCENLLANCLYSQSKYADAEQFYRHALDVRMRMLGEEHADTALSHNNLAKSLYWQHKYEQAVADHRAALVVRRKVLGPEAIDTRQTMVDLAEALAAWAGEQEQAERWDPARSARQEVIALRTERYGQRDWHATEARLALEDTEKLAKMTKADRARLAKAEAAHKASSAAYSDDSDYEGATNNARKAWAGGKNAAAVLLGPENLAKQLQERKSAGQLPVRASPICRGRGALPARDRPAEQ